jgi:uncharacterized protein YuzE
MPITFRIEADGAVKVLLRAAEVASQMDDEVILDVDHEGHWLRGIEILESVGFDLARAVKPFNPKRPLEAAGIGVTYDADANAAFFHLKMKTLPLGKTTRYSHSITPAARFGLDNQGGLVWIAFSVDEANASPEDFLSLVDAPIERLTAGKNAK